MQRRHWALRCCYIGPYSHVVDGDVIGVSERSEVIIMGAIAHWIGRASAASQPQSCFCVRDCLHTDRAAQVPGDMIADVVASWLADFEAVSPLVDDLARAVCEGDWPSAHALAARLSVEIEVEAAAATPRQVRSASTQDRLLPASW